MMRTSERQRRLRSVAILALLAGKPFPTTRDNGFLRLLWTDRFSGWIGRTCEECTRCIDFDVTSCRLKEREADFVAFTGMCCDGAISDLRAGACPADSKVLLARRRNVLRIGDDINVILSEALSGEL